jgi:hypothetical protein
MPKRATYIPLQSRSKTIVKTRNKRRKRKLLTTRSIRCHNTQRAQSITPTNLKRERDTEYILNLLVCSILISGMFSDTTANRTVIQSLVHSHPIHTEAQKHVPHILWLLMKGIKQL